MSILFERKCQSILRSQSKTKKSGTNNYSCSYLSTEKVYFVLTAWLTSLLLILALEIIPTYVYCLSQ